MSCTSTASPARAPPADCSATAAKSLRIAGSRTRRFGWTIFIRGRRGRSSNSTPNDALKCANRENADRFQGDTMATFISLLSFTDQGIRTIKDAPKRLDAFRATAKKLGVTLKDYYMTVGHYDVVIVLDGNDEAVATALLKVASLGNVRTETLRAFSETEMGRITGNIP